jgi:hypothetical protein
MKTKVTLIIMLAAVCLGINKLVAQDLVPGMNYSYNPPGSNGIITNINVDVCNNESTPVSTFQVAIYLYDPSNGNYWILDQTTVNSLSGNACITISNWDIDINNTPNIPAGSSYRIGTWVDSGEIITESDENNNAGLMQGNISYTPSSGTGIAEPGGLHLLQNFPNPAKSITRFRFSLASGSDVSLQLFNTNGQLVDTPLDQKMEAGEHELAYDCSTLPAGIYYCMLSTPSGTVTRKLAVVK